MDIDQMKSTAQDQIELMMMMSELYSSSEDVDVAADVATTSTAVVTNFSSCASAGGGGGGGGAQYLAVTPSPAAAGSGGRSMEAMREVVFRVAAMQPIRIEAEAVRAPRRRNVRISKDPQSVAARHRRERISERIRILQRIVPGGTKMDTASMLDEAVHYVKFLKTQVQTLTAGGGGGAAAGIGFPVAMYSGSYMHAAPKACAAQNVEQYRDHV